MVKQVVDFDADSCSQSLEIWSMTSTQKAFYNCDKGRPCDSLNLSHVLGEISILIQLSNLWPIKDSRFKSPGNVEQILLKQAPSLFSAFTDCFIIPNLICSEYVVFTLRVKTTYKYLEVFTYLPSPHTSISIIYVFIMHLFTNCICWLIKFVQGNTIKYKSFYVLGNYLQSYIKHIFTTKTSNSKDVGYLER